MKCPFDKTSCSSRQPEISNKIMQNRDYRESTNTQYSQDGNFLKKVFFLCHGNHFNKISSWPYHQTTFSWHKMNSEMGSLWISWKRLWIQNRMFITGIQKFQREWIQKTEHDRESTNTHLNTRDCCMRKIHNLSHKNSNNPFHKTVCSPPKLRNFSINKAKQNMT